MSIPAAVLARLQAAVDPVYDGLVPVDERGQPLTQRYGVMYSDAGARAADDLVGTADRYVYRWTVTSVGEDRIQAEWVAVRLRDALLDAPLVVEGWSTTPVTHEASSPIRRDEDLPGDPLFFAVDTYSLTATR